MIIGIDDGQTDPKWPKLLSLTAHELRSPLTVVGGYIRMLLKDRAGPLTEPQRRLMEEAEKSCGRLSSLVAEVSELAHLESGKAAFNEVCAVRLGATEICAFQKVRRELRLPGRPSGSCSKDI